MNNSLIPAKFIYDIISPFAYFFIKQRHELTPLIDLEPVPIFLGGLLRQQKNVGPAEVSEKRKHTYQLCVWKSQKLGIPFQFPPRHPFSSSSAQRLLLREKANWDMLEAAFDFVWQMGRDPDTEWSEFCTFIGLAATTEKPQAEEVKTQLKNNTDWANQQQIFGVPSVLMRGEVFFGSDVNDWLIACAKNELLRSSEPYSKVLRVVNPLQK